jgi:hypothetical protein
MSRRFLFATVRLAISFSGVACSFSQNTVTAKPSGTLLLGELSLKPGVGIWHTCGGPFKPLPREFVYAFGGCDLGKVTDRVDIGVAPACDAELLRDALRITNKVLADLQYVPKDGRFAPDKFPLELRKQVRGVAWKKNNWAEVHYLDVDFRITVGQPAADLRLRYQVLVGPQPFEKEMQDVSSSEDVTRYYGDILRRWHTILDYLVNQYIGKCPSRNAPLTKGYLYSYEDAGRNREGIISQDDLVKYFGR